MDKEIRVSITPGTLVATLVILAGAWLLWYLRDLALLILTAVVLASAIRPGIQFFMRWHLPRILAVLAMYLVVFGALFSIVYFFLPPILSQAAAFLSSLPQYLNAIDLPFTSVPTSEIISGGESARSVISSIEGAFANTSEGVLRLVATFFGGAFSTILVIVLSFYFAVQEQGIEDFLRLIVPLRQEEYVIDLWHRSQKKIGLWMQGQIMLSVLAGILVYLGLLMLGYLGPVPFPLLLGVLTALCELIPIFGSLFAGAVAVAVTWTSGGFALAFIVAGLFIVVNQFEANLIYPLVVRKIVGVPPLLVIIALIVGAEVAGFLGALLSVPVAAILQEFVSDLDKGRRTRLSRAT